MDALLCLVGGASHKLSDDAIDTPCVRIGPIAIGDHATAIQAASIFVMVLLLLRNPSLTVVFVVYALVEYATCIVPGASCGIDHPFWHHCSAALLAVAAFQCMRGGLTLDRTMIGFIAAVAGGTIAEQVAFAEEDSDKKTRFRVAVVCCLSTYVAYAYVISGSPTRYVAHFALFVVGYCITSIYIKSTKFWSIGGCPEKGATE